MRDGYYLSTYLHIDKLSAAMGWQHRHDQNFSLWHKVGNQVELIHHWDLERNSGIKHHANSFGSIEEARNAINSLLSVHKLSLEDMQEVWGTPGLDTCEDYHSLTQYPTIPYHNIAHLFSALFCDSEKFYKDQIIGLAIDGAPDRVIDGSIQFLTEYAGCYVNQGKIEIFPVCSPGILWYQAHNLYNLREGTLMALGSASESYLLDVDIAPLLQQDDSYSAIKAYLSEIKSKLDNLDFKDEGRVFNKFDPRFSFEENKTSMYVKVLQAISIAMVEKTIDALLSKYNLTPENTCLALAGGYALNCPTNSHLMKKYKFKAFMAPPCVNDSGLSLGMGLYAFYKKMGFLKFSLSHAYYGDEDNNLEILESSYAPYVESSQALNPEQFVKDIIEHPVVWFNGCAEIGPRALGNRSILGDSRSKESKKILNIIKQREWWRPVAPIVLEEDVSDWYLDSYPSPFMLHTFQVREEKLSLIPTVTHLDGSARVQTLKEEENSLLYKCIQAFKKATGVPIIANTSLNDKGEPIINKIEEVLNFALRKGIQVVYLNGKRVKLFNHHKYYLNTPFKRTSFFRSTKVEQEESYKQENPHNIPWAHLSIYCRLDLLRTHYDIKDYTQAMDFYNIAQFLLDNRWRADGRPIHNYYLKFYEQYMSVLSSQLSNYKYAANK